MPPATESVRERVIQDLEAAVAAIDATAGGGLLYYNTMGEVVRWEAWEPERRSPLAMVIGLGSTEDDSTHQVTTVEMSFVVIVSFEIADGANSQRDLSRLVDDVRRAIVADPQRSGLALDTHVTGTDYQLPSDDWPYAGGRVEGNVTYRHKYGDPYSLWNS